MEFYRKGPTSIFHFREKAFIKAMIYNFQKGKTLQNNMKEFFWMVPFKHKVGLTS